MNYYIQKLPQLAVNDDSIKIVKWLKKQGDYIQKYDLICIVESSKATMEVEAENSGFLFQLVNEGCTAKSGEPFAIISESKEINIDNLMKSIDKSSKNEEKEFKRWTKKAEIIARKYGVNIEDVPAIGIIQEMDIINYIKTKQNVKEEIEDLVKDVYQDTLKTKILILGGGRGCVQVIDTIFRNGNAEIVGILDDNENLHGKLISGIKVLGPISMVYELREKKMFQNLIISFSNDIKGRAYLYNKLRNDGFIFSNVIDKSVQLHSNVKIGTGNLILANCRIGPCSIIGDNNFLSAYVNIEHHNILGSNCTFGPGVFTSSRVHIGDNVKFGTGIFIEPGVKIGSNSIISSGSILTFDVPENSIVKKHVEVKIFPLDSK